MSKLSRFALWIVLFGAFCQAVFLLPDDAENPYAILCLIGFGIVLLSLAVWPEGTVQKISLGNFRQDYVRAASKMPPLALALSACGALCMALGGVLWLIL